MSATTPISTATTPYPIAFADVVAARERIAPYLRPTPLRSYATLDAAVGHDIRVLVKHENHQPTNAFKVRNALSAMTHLSDEQRSRGVIGASRGNHGLGLAYGGRLLGIAVTICVPRGNNPEKNEAMRGLGAEVVEEGRDYDESLLVADRLVRERGLTLVHSTNNRDVIVISLGGGSQAVGALTVLREMRPGARVYAVQAEGAPAGYESWRAGKHITTTSANTFADGIATRSPYELTFSALRDGLADFVLVSDDEIAGALRLLLRTTHTLVEGAGAAGLAGLFELRESLTGQRVAIVLSGGNIDQATLKWAVG
jgi:threonine dehydratase